MNARKQSDRQAVVEPATVEKPGANSKQQRPNPILEFVLQKRRAMLIGFLACFLVWLSVLGYLAFRGASI